MIHFFEKKDCCGCTACYSICPTNSIQMISDSEGFLYPNVDTQKCIGCNKCEQVCPIANKYIEKKYDQYGYICQNKNEEIVKDSTSGGIFTAIARNVIGKGGVVFGAEITVNLVIHHTYVESEDELYRFRGSKYVQSDLENTFRQAKQFLDAGRWVCFSGTPCQIEGLDHYLGKKYEKLVCVDVVCRAVPSPKIFSKYLEYQNYKLKDKIVKIRFRDKFFGYKYSVMKIVTQNEKKVYHRGADSDQWYRAFFSNICDRPSCYECQFKKRYRISDFTLWDCFPVGRFSKALDNDKGATRVLVHTDKGKALMNEILNDIYYMEVGPDDLMIGSKEMTESVPANRKREDFFHDADQLNGIDLFEKWFSDSIGCKFNRMIRMICYRIGLYDTMRKFYVRVTNKY